MEITGDIDAVVASDTRPQRPPGTWAQILRCAVGHVAVNSMHPLSAAGTETKSAKPPLAGPPTVATSPTTPTTTTPLVEAPLPGFTAPTATHPSSSKATPPSSSSPTRHLDCRTTGCLHSSRPRPRLHGRSTGPAATRRLPPTLGCVAVPATRPPTHEGPPPLASTRAMPAWATPVVPTPLA